MKSRTIGLISGLCLLFIGAICFSNFAEGSMYDSEGTRFLNYQESFQVYIDLKEGDHLSWTYETYDSEFLVSVFISAYYSYETLSYNGTKGSGIFQATETYLHLITFSNVDNTSHRSGFINYSLKLRLIPGYNFIGLALVIIGISILLTILTQKRIKNALIINCEL